MKDKEQKQRRAGGFRQRIITALAGLWGEDANDGPETTIGQAREAARQQKASPEAKAEIEAIWEREKAGLAGEMILLGVNLLIGTTLAVLITSREVSAGQLPWTALAAMTAHVGGGLLWSRMDRMARIGGHTTSWLGTWIAASAL